MASWKKLNLGSAFARPPINTLAALRLEPKSTLYATVRHDIGCLQPDTRTGRKLWWHGTRGCEDLSRLKKDYDIWWCLVPPFDAAGVESKEEQQR